MVNTHVTLGNHSSQAKCFLMCFPCSVHYQRWLHRRLQGSVPLLASRCFVAVLLLGCLFGVLHASDFFFLNYSPCLMERQSPIASPLSLPRFRVTKVEHKANQKERRSLMSVSGTESVNGDVPVTPVKRDRSGTE